MKITKFYAEKIPPASVDIKTWGILKFLIVYQTFALSQIVRLTIVTLTSLSCKIKIIKIMLQCFFVT
jgi:hypothetical protein